MKKIVVAIAFLVMSSMVLEAQNNFRFGFQASPTFSWMSSNDNKINGTGSNLGGKLGVMAEYYFDAEQKYAFVSGLGFAFNQGGKLKHDVGGNYWPDSDLSLPGLDSLQAGATLHYKLQYVEIPLGLRMNTRYFGSIRYYAELPIFTIGLLTAARGDIIGTNNDTEKENIRKDVAFFNMSWGFGGGAEYEISEGTTLIGGLFYNQSFIDLTSDDAVKYSGSGSESEDSKGSFGTLTVRLGVMF
ncbi:MAG: outer membrane beta-barrel protein [Saprospiraceae bacterium]